MMLVSGMGSLWLRTRIGKKPSPGRHSPTELMSMQDAADLSETSPQTVDRWIRVGLKIYRAAKRIRIGKIDLADPLSLHFDQ